MREAARQQGTTAGREDGGKMWTKNASQIIHLNKKVGNNIGTVWKGRAVWWESHPQSVLTGAERRVGDGLAAGGSFVFLPVSPPPPTPLPPLGTCLLPEFLFLSYSIQSFLFFFVICLSTLPSLPFFMFDWHWHRRSVWRQGLLITSNMPGILCTVLNAFTWHQGNCDYLHTKLFFCLFTV